MLDLDGIDRDQAEAITYSLDPGVYVLLKSSADSYNIISLTAYSVDQITDLKASIRQDDADHLKIGMFRGFWITRISKKADKSRPKLVDVVTVEDDAIEKHKVSRPHYYLFKELFDGFELVAPDYLDMKYQNCCVEKVKYPTLSEKPYGFDDIKPEVSNND